MTHQRRDSITDMTIIYIPRHSSPYTNIVWASGSKNNFLGHLPFLFFARNDDMLWKHWLLGKLLYILSVSSIIIYHTNVYMNIFTSKLFDQCHRDLPSFSMLLWDFHTSIWREKNWVVFKKWWIDLYCFVLRIKILVKAVA